MADNPFDDPDVKQAASGGSGMPPPVPDNNAYDDEDIEYEDDKNKNNDNAYDNAYDDDDNNQGRSEQIDMVAMGASALTPDQKKDIAVGVGSAAANQANQAVKSAQDDYNESQQTQLNQHEAPPPPQFCIRLFNWFPLQYFAFAGGVFLVVGPILDLIYKPQFIQVFIYIYIVIFGIMTMFVEAPSWTCTRAVQLKFFFWFRLLSRTWGRAWFYLFVAILCYAGIDDGESGAAWSVFSGVWITITSILSFIFSRMAAKKFSRMREFVAAGAEGDEMEGKFMRKFDELDGGGMPGTIGSVELVKLAQQAGRELSNSERHAIQTFLDESCNGYISKEDFMKQFVTQYSENGFKQRFL